MVKKVIKKYFGQEHLLDEVLKQNRFPFFDPLFFFHGCTRFLFYPVRNAAQTCLDTKKLTQ
jgi:hypothetical protein